MYNFTQKHPNLLHQKGIPSDILARVLLESFHANESLISCKLLNFPKSASASLSAPVVPVLSELKAKEILIAKMPDTPNNIADLKAGYELMKRVKCCFDINTVRKVGKGIRKGVRIIEISTLSESADRIIVINHIAVKTDRLHTMLPTYCSICRRNRCSICDPIEKCVPCNGSCCYSCSQKCRSCDGPICLNCVTEIECEHCGAVCCEYCDGGPENELCESCGEMKYPSRYIDYDIDYY